MWFCPVARASVANPAEELSLEPVGVPVGGRGPRRGSGVGVSSTPSEGRPSSVDVSRVLLLKLMLKVFQSVLNEATKHWKCCTPPGVEVLAPPPGSILPPPTSGQQVRRSRKASLSERDSEQRAACAVFCRHLFWNVKNACDEK